MFLLALGCVGDTVTAPSVCPAYCANNGLQPRDTVLQGVVHGDSSYRGYQVASTAGEMQVAGPGGVTQSRAFLRFYPFRTRYTIFAGDTTTVPVAVIDSLRFSFNLRKRTAGTVKLAVYRLPRTTDTVATYDSLTPYFQDSLQVIELTVAPDTGLLQFSVPAASLPTLVSDSFQIAIGLAITTPGASVNIGTNEVGLGGFVERFIRVDSAGVRIARNTENRLAEIDTYVFQALAAPPAGVLTIGGAPSARALMRLDLPLSIFNSTTVVRATLLLIPAGPALSAAGDTTRVVAHALATDIGAKSPVSQAAQDGDIRSGAFVPPGSTDTIRVDITALVRAWRADATRPHTMVLRTTPEGGTLSEVRFWSSADPTRKPRIHVTYVRPFLYGVN
ncbi:MAG: hypothetical protein EXR93_10950 [Gemmatimonadetes bacterium]|nr:hypothetical protein [Gemmatimonadota bacterium]